jgi:hypothetical protein
MAAYKSASWFETLVSDMKLAAMVFAFFDAYSLFAL